MSEFDTVEDYIEHKIEEYRAGRVAASTEDAFDHTQTSAWISGYMDACVDFDPYNFEEVTA